MIGGRREGSYRVVRMRKTNPDKRVVILMMTGSPMPRGRLNGGETIRERETS